MKFSREDGAFQLAGKRPGEGWFVHTIQEWDWLFIGGERFNWIDFHLIQIYFENDRHFHAWEAMIIFFGLGLRFRMNCKGSKEEYDKLTAEMPEFFKTGEKTDAEDSAD